MPLQSTQSSDDVTRSRWRANLKDGAHQQAKKVICKLKQTKHDVIVIVRTMSRVMHVMLSMLHPTMRFESHYNLHHGTLPIALRAIGGPLLADWRELNLHCTI